MSLYKAMEFITKDVNGKIVFVVLDETLSSIGEFDTIEEAKTFIDILKKNQEIALARSEAEIQQHAETFVELTEKSKEPR